MKYLIYVSWQSTDTNHAGMKYLCRRLAQLYPEEYTAIESLRPQEYKRPRHGSLFSRFNPKYLFSASRIRKDNIRVAENLRLNSGDTVFLMEYMDKTVDQYDIARILRKNYPDVKIYGMSHLVPSRIDKMFDDRTLKEWASAVDSIITLGSSLTDYYKSRDIDSVITTFHYVDDYYRSDSVTDTAFKVLAQGNLKRDPGLLRRIVEDNPDIPFVICQGNKDLSRQFSRCHNVTLMPFISEEELRQLMRECPVSLNVMKDTIGSNVIVTSMAMGQAMVCSDVGSIRDYCDDSNCIFCVTLQDFSSALRHLKNDKAALLNMRESSLKKSEHFMLRNFSKALSDMTN